MFNQMTSNNGYEIYDVVWRLEGEREGVYKCVVMGGVELK